MTKQNAKFIQSLAEKKTRKEKGLFLVEGEKSVIELASSDFEIKELYLTQEIFTQYKNKLASRKNVIEIVEAGELEKISTLEHNNTALAVVKQKENTPFAIEKNEIALVLDDIRDPGNLGTIIRTADWYGVKKIVCSTTTAELYNPKVIAASMGSFTRVHLFYTDLENFLKKSALPIIGAELAGTDAHTFAFPSGGILLMGSESNGISPALRPIMTEKITIPSYGNAESLNVAQATAILLDNWKRTI